MNDDNRITVCDCCGTEVEHEGQEDLDTVLDALAELAIEPMVAFIASCGCGEERALFHFDSSDHLSRFIAAVSMCATPELLENMTPPAKGPNAWKYLAAPVAQPWGVQVILGAAVPLPVLPSVATSLRKFLGEAYGATSGDEPCSTAVASAQAATSEMGG